MPKFHGRVIVEKPIEEVFDALVEHRQSAAENEKSESMNANLHRPDLIEYDGDSKLVGMGIRFDLEPRGWATELALTMDFRLHGWAGIVMWLMRKRLAPDFGAMGEAMLRDLKQAIETGQPVSESGHLAAWQAESDRQEAERAARFEAEEQARRAADEAKREAAWQREHKVQQRVAWGYVAIGKALVLVCPIAFVAGQTELATFLPVGGLLMYLGGRLIRKHADRDAEHHPASAGEPSGG